MASEDSERARKAGERGAPAKPADREARLAKALRDNLRRRKAAARQAPAAPEE